MSPESDPLGITGRIAEGDDDPGSASVAGASDEPQGTNGPPSPSRVDLVVASWAAMAAFEARTGKVAGWPIFEVLQARGAPDEDIDAALELLDLEQDAVAAALEIYAEDCRRRVQEAEGELQSALTALHVTELHAWGAAAVTFAHGVAPHALTVQDALGEMTPTEWLLFERLTEPDHTDAQETG